MIDKNGNNSSFEDEDIPSEENLDNLTSSVENKDESEVENDDIIKKDESKEENENLEPYQSLENKFANLSKQDLKDDDPYIQEINEAPPFLEDNQPKHYPNNSSIENKVEHSPYAWRFSDYDKLAKTSAPRKKGRVVLEVIIGAVVLILAGFLVFDLVNGMVKQNDLELAPENEEISNEEKLQEEYKSNIEIVEHEDLDNGLSASVIYETVSPSVVGIQTYDTEMYGSLPVNEGSGIIMSKEGEIITNSHVVYQAKSIKVTLLNGESYSATLIGEDKYTDVAVIKLDKPPENLVVAKFGDSENLKIGDRVVAIGNPGGLDFAGSTTQGIISGLERKVSDGTGFSIKAIQVDAAINPGNSGGALINRFGQVIGITSSKISGASYEGMGFALPIHKAKPIIDQIITTGRVLGKALIGITYLPDKFIDTARAQKYELQTGIIVESVNENSDAFIKNVRVGDIIHKIDATTIAHIDDIAESIKDKKPGETITLTIYRFETEMKEGPLIEVIIEIILMEDLS